MDFIFNSFGCCGNVQKDNDKDNNNNKNEIEEIRTKIKFETEDDSNSAIHQIIKKKIEVRYYNKRKKKIKF